MALSVGACSTLPNSGPTAPEIEDGAAHNNQIGFKLVDMSPAVLSAVDGAATPSMRATLGAKPPASVTRVGIGDILAISIFMANAGSFSAPQSSTTGGGQDGMSGGGGGGIQNQSLPPLQVDEHGDIVVPYGGRLHVAGHTPREIEDMIDRSLSGTVFRPQSLVNVARNLRNTVMLSGDIRKPGRYPIDVADERLLDIITQAGGAAFPSEDMSVKVTRGTGTVQVPLTRVTAGSVDDVPLYPGDDIQLTYRPRTFLSFGAGGKVTQIKFDSDTLSLAEGIARIGGPADDRADPSAVYLFRFETPAVMSRMGSPAVETPVIYRIDMLDPQSYFELQKFAMRDKDLIYVANARSNKFFRFLTVVNSVFIPVATTASLTR
jgi:polysaccharide export outer membrane protein